MDFLDQLKEIVAQRIDSLAEPTQEVAQKLASYDVAVYTDEDGCWHINVTCEDRPHTTEVEDIDMWVASSLTAVLMYLEAQRPQD